MKTLLHVALIILLTQAAFSTARATVQTAEEDSKPVYSSGGSAKRGSLSISLNRDKWLVVSGRGAEANDNLYVFVDGKPGPRVNLYPSRNGGTFEKLYPVLQFAMFPRRTFHVRIAVGPAGMGHPNRPAFERISWQGRVSATNGVQPE